MGDSNSHSDLLFGIRRSVRYHSRRQGFFEALNNTISFALVVLGSGAVYSVAQDHDRLTVAVGLSVAALSSGRLIFKLGERAARHSRFVSDFTRLEKRLAFDESKEAVRRVTEGRLELEAAEPPVKRALDVLCHNELVQAMGIKEGNQYEVPWKLRLLSHLCNFASHDFKQVAQTRLSP